MLGRLAANTTYPDVELVIVDDGSTDGSREILRRWRDSGSFSGDVHLIEQANRGAIDALNAALSATDGELCVQIDSDASIETPGWIERMLALMTLDDRVGVVTGKVVMDSGALHTCGVNVVGAGMARPPVEAARGSGAPALAPPGGPVHGGRGRRRGATRGGGRRRDGLLHDVPPRRRSGRGGYDTGYAPVWFDDVDLCMSIRRLGRKVFYMPDVRVVHHLAARRGPRPRPTLARRLATRLPGGARERIEERFRVDLNGHFTAEQLGRLEHHYRYWRDKWGWDVRNPDMDEIRRRWGDTEICWATDGERRAAGEEILLAFERTRRGAPR